MKWSSFAPLKNTLKNPTRPSVVTKPFLHGIYVILQTFIHLCSGYISKQRKSYCDVKRVQCIKAMVITNDPGGVVGGGKLSLQFYACLLGSNGRTCIWGTTQRIVLYYQDKKIICLSYTDNGTGFVLHLPFVFLCFPPFTCTLSFPLYLLCASCFDFCHH